MLTNPGIDSNNQELNFMMKTQVKGWLIFQEIGEGDPGLMRARYE